MKWLRLIRFIRNHRIESGCARFKIITTQTKVVISTDDKRRVYPADHIRFYNKNLGSIIKTNDSIGL